MDFKTNFPFVFLFFLLINSVLGHDDLDCSKEQSDICRSRQDDDRVECCRVDVAKNKTSTDASSFKCCTEDEYYDQFPKLSDAVAQPRSIVKGVLKLVFVIVGVAVFVIVACVVCCCCCPFCLFAKKSKGTVIRTADAEQQQQQQQPFQQQPFQQPPPAQGYPQQPMHQGQPFPPVNPGYPPPQQPGYPPQQPGYPPQQAGYPPQQAGYPPSQGGYPPPQQGGYPDNPPPYSEAVAKAEYDRQAAFNPNS